MISKALKVLFVTCSIVAFFAWGWGTIRGAIALCVIGLLLAIFGEWDGAFFVFGWMALTVANFGLLILLGRAINRLGHPHGPFFRWFYGLGEGTLWHERGQR